MVRESVYRPGLALQACSSCEHWLHPPMSSSFSASFVAKLSTQVSVIFLLYTISSVPSVSLFMDGDDAACYGPSSASISRAA